ncbi:MAG TPA: transposase [Tepidisphaeraceae bacterium]|nr:transposase [Tepidisphaeraceae bacterium]
MRRRHELTDEEWGAVERRLPGRDGDPGRTAADTRLFVNAVLSVAKTGVPCRGPPERSGRWNSVRRRSDRRSAAGVRADLAAALGGPDPAGPHLGSTTVKARHAAAGSRRLPGGKKRGPTPGGASDARAAGGRPSRATRRRAAPGVSCDWS